MRIRVHISGRDAVRVPINQNYFLASAIYHVLDARPDYAKFLHDHGYTHQPSGRRFKLFVFSPLMCRNRRVVGDSLVLGPGPIEWIISSPMAEFVTALAEGLLSQGKISIRGTELPVESVEAAPLPEVSTKMSFTCLSPIVVARPGDTGDYAHFCTHEDPDFSPRVRANLIRKFELVHGSSPAESSFEMSFDPDYISKRNGKVTKLIDIRGIKIRGVLAPFDVIGSTELIQIGLETGFGERGSMGFGCVVKHSDRKNGLWQSC